MGRLTVTSLAKRYKTRKVVKDVSLHLDQGEVVGLLGPNGAGKTTSFYMIVGLIKADQGRILLDEKDITHLPIHERAHLGIGYLPQEASIFRKLSVADNILAILELRKNLSDEERELKLEHLLNEFHLGAIRDTMGISLSGGERRRVEIARALATEPKFILLDEPFAGIDPLAVMDIKNMIIHLQKRGIGILITDHNVRETLAICSRGYIVNDGKVICEGTPKTLLNSQLVRDVYLGNDFDL
ncbi:MAG: LPS export ABC transporter ATP-binding protein [Gammaproteobacteria bacterium]|nr:LPS export ABC transporter ATP-binding protein [Gammaproteobacteria bacterium]